MLIRDTKLEFATNIYRKFVKDTYFINNKYDSKSNVKYWLELYLTNKTLCGLMSDDYVDILTANTLFGQAINVYNSYYTTIGQEDKYFIYIQSTPLNTWNITHNLHKYPAVTITDDSGIEIEAEIQHISENQTIIRFSTPLTGKAFFN